MADHGTASRTQRAKMLKLWAADPHANGFAIQLLLVTKGVCSMLVLTRKYQEKIRIGNDITITVLRTKGKAVRLGIEAPANVPVIRGELKFEDEPVAVATAVETSAPATSARRRTDGFSEPAWTTKRLSREGVSQPRMHPAAEVGHRRVSREKVPELLPRLVSGNAPLRALMEKRSTASV
jgi:carbon storage regulator CsrA